MGIDKNGQLKNLLIKEYITGTPDNYSADEQANLNLIKEKMEFQNPRKKGRQRCEDLFISIRFQSTIASWHEIPHDTHGVPMFYGTDAGACCYLSPHIFIGQMPKNMSYGDKYHKLHAPAKQGEEEGLEMLLDTEQFNYGYIRDDQGIGLTMSLNDHRAISMMQFSSFHLGPGRENQIVIKPIITYTSEDALNSMTPDERGCYKHDRKLEALSWDHGYHYEMDNCLIDQGILATYWNCRCIPLFTAPGNVKYGLLHKLNTTLLAPGVYWQYIPCGAQEGCTGSHL